MKILTGEEARKLVDEAMKDKALPDEEMDNVVGGYSEDVLGIIDLNEDEYASLKSGNWHKGDLFALEYLTYWIIDLEKGGRIAYPLKNRDKILEIFEDYHFKEEPVWKPWRYI